MTKAERSLVESGESELVLVMRQEFQRTMRNDLVARLPRVAAQAVGRAAGSCAAADGRSAPARSCPADRRRARDGVVDHYLFASTTDYRLATIDSQVPSFSNISPAPAN